MIEATIILAWAPLCVAAQACHLRPDALPARCEFSGVEPRGVEPLTPRRAKATLGIRRRSRRIGTVNSMAEIGLLRFARVALEVAEALPPDCRTESSKRTFIQPQPLDVVCLLRYEDRTPRARPGFGWLSTASC